MFMKKQPSPVTNPASQSGFITFSSSTVGLGTGLTSGKAFFKASVKPKFIEALMLTISLKPFKLKCSLSESLLTTHLNS